MLDSIVAMEGNINLRAEETRMQQTQKEIRKQEASLEKAIFIHEWRNASQLYDNDSAKKELTAKGKYTTHRLWGFAMNALASLYINNEGWKRHSSFVIPPPWRTPAMARMVSWLTMYGFGNDIRELDGTPQPGIFDGQVDTRILTSDSEEDGDEEEKTTSTAAPLATIHDRPSAPSTTSEGASSMPVETAAGSSTSSHYTACVSCLAEANSQEGVPQQDPSHVAPNNHLAAAHTSIPIESDTEAQDNDPEHDKENVVANLDGADVSPDTSSELSYSSRSASSCGGSPSMTTSGATTPEPEVFAAGGLGDFGGHHTATPDNIEEAVAEAARRRISAAGRTATSKRKRSRLKLL